jgi:drug/metabolite transporter (DMT)-like permease
MREPSETITFAVRIAKTFARCRMPGVKSAFGARDALLLVLLAFIWGHSFLFIKIAVAVVAPIWIVTLRMLTGGLLVLAVIILRRASVPRDASTLAKLAAIGVLGSALPWALQAWSQRYLDSGLVAVLNAFTPLTTLGIAVLMGQERLERQRVIGIAIAIAGTLVVIGGEVGSGRSPLALFAAVSATVGYALAAVLTRAHVSGRVPLLPAAAIQLLAGALFLWPIATAVNGPPPTQLSPLVALSLLALGVFGSGIAFLIYFSLIARVGATNTAMVTYLTPIVAMSAGALYRDERFGSNVFLGTAALIGGVWLAQRRSVPVSLPAATGAEPAIDAK